MESEAAFAEADPLPVADDEVIEQVDVEQFAGGSHVACDLDVVGRWGGIARGMIVYEDDGRAIEAHGLFEDLADAEQRRVEAAHVQGLDFLDAVFGVEADHPQMLLVEVAHFDQHELSGVARGTNLEAFFEAGDDEAAGELESGFEASSAYMTDAVVLLELFDAEAMDADYAAGLSEELLGELESLLLLAVAEQECDEFGIAEGVGALREQALAGVRVIGEFADAR